MVDDADEDDTDNDDADIDEVGAAEVRLEEEAVGLAPTPGANGSCS